MSLSILAVRARRVRNSSARRRTWIASGKSVCLRVSGLPLSPPLLLASALGPLRQRLPMAVVSSASASPAYMPNTPITPIRQATIRTIRRRRQLTRRPPAIHLNRVIRLRRGRSGGNIARQLNQQELNRLQAAPINPPPPYYPYPHRRRAIEARKTSGRVR